MHIQPLPKSMNIPNFRALGKEIFHVSRNGRNITVGSG
jgi:hypothetical protein